MPLGITFRWNTPQVQAAKSAWDRNSMTEGLNSVASAISTAKDSRYAKKLQERRDAIEDEDRARRIAEEDRRKQVYGEAADIIRRRQSNLAALRSKRDALASEIEALKKEIGGF